MSSAPRILFVSFPERGHFNPMSRVARRAVELGAEVLFFSLEGDLSARLAEAGLDVRSGHPERGDIRTTSSADGRTPDDFVARVRRGGAWYARWLRFALLDGVLRQMSELEAFVGAVKPDLIAGDALAYAAAGVAERTGIPWAALSTNLVGAVPESWTCEYVDILTKFDAELREIYAEAGVPTAVRMRRGDLVSPWLNTIFTTESLTPRTASENDYAELVGPALPSSAGSDATFPWSRLAGDQPTVYVASGTGFSFPAPFLSSMADAGTALGYRMVFAGAGAVLALSGRDDVIAVRSAPQLQLLERVTAMVGHGGANSFLEALSRARPLAILPLGTEQPLQARLVEERGLGVWIRDEGRDACEAVLRTIVTDPLIAERVRAVSVSLAAADGAGRAAELLVELAKRRAPMEAS